MQKATSNNLFNIETFSFKGETNHVSQHGAFYQQFASKLIKAVYDTEALSQAGARLVALADHALNLQATDAVEQISRLLAHAPLPPPYQSIGDYYQVFCLKRRGETERARAGFQRLAESPGLPLKFRARAIQALGISYSERGHYGEAVPFFLEAARAASASRGGDLPTVVNAQLMIGVSRSVSGDHEGALRHLETLRPLVRLLSPGQSLAPYFYVNSLAVELGEAGRLEEARQLAAVAVRSPYARLHPEWRETYDEVVAKMRGASPSTVAIAAWPQEPVAGAALPDTVLPYPTNNVVMLPVAARTAAPVNAGDAPSQPGRVITYRSWQQPLPEPAEPLYETFTYNDLEQMSIADKQTALLDVIYSDHVTHHTLDELLVAAGKIKADAPAS